jgi:hypothetical protein
MTSPASKNHQNGLAWLVLICALLAVAAYHMVWQTHKVAAFNSNAFDLAEWVSLHPTVRAESPVLFTSLLLRLPLIILPLVMVLATTALTSEKARWIWRGVAFLVVLRLNPPVDFYPWGDGSPNDQQLGYLTAAGLGAVLVFIIVGKWLKFLWQPLAAILLIASLIVSIEGYNRAQKVLGSIQIETDLGGGLVLYAGFLIAAILGIVGAWAISLLKNKKRV